MRFLKHNSTLFNQYYHSEINIQEKFKSQQVIIFKSPERIYNFQDFYD
ncbi:protein of unknown function [Chryseobacterium sp. JV274]|nr:protein of unknown function [Chryseobacterium sp. JV274]